MPAKTPGMTLNSVAALVFAGNDLIVLAKTGSGRMGAFALPILQELLSNREGKDLIALVQTGSGKTSTFMLPILQKLLSNRQTEQFFFACVLSPMRELMIQIVEQFEALGSTIGLRYSMLLICRCLSRTTGHAPGLSKE